MRALIRAYKVVSNHEKYKVCCESESWQYPRYDGEPSMSKLAMRDTFADIASSDTALMIGENAARVYGFDGARAGHS